jgi:hypothetical protein
MKRTWQLTDLEFVVAWEDSKEGFLPFPFTYTSRIPLWDDYLRAKYETREGLRGTLDQSFRDILDTLAQPDIKLEVTAWDAMKPDDPKKCVRMLAARRGDRAVLVTQQTGETVMHSVGFTFTECDALSMADVVVAALPAAEAGRRAHLVLAGSEDDETDYTYGKSDVFDSFDDAAVRYAIDEQSPPVAQGVDAQRLTAMINTRIAAVVRAIKDERA